MDTEQNYSASVDTRLLASTFTSYWVKFHFSLVGLFSVKANRGRVGSTSPSRGPGFIIVVGRRNTTFVTAGVFKMFASS